MPADQQSQRDCRGAGDTGKEEEEEEEEEAEEEDDDDGGREPVRVLPVPELDDDDRDDVGVR